MLNFNIESVCGYRNDLQKTLAVKDGLEKHILYSTDLYIFFNKVYFARETMKIVDNIVNIY